MTVLKGTNLDNSTNKSAVSLKVDKSLSDPGKTHDHGIPMLSLIKTWISLLDQTF